MQKQYITAEELQTIMGISRGKAYEIIRSCNQELKAQGFITIAGTRCRSRRPVRIGQIRLRHSRTCGICRKYRLELFDSIMIPYAL